VPRSIVIIWLDLIIAALLIICGTGMWSATEKAVSYALHDNAPDKREFLARENVRTFELKLKNAQDELDADRKKWIEQRLAGTRPDELGSEITSLEISQLAAEKKVREARRQATREFERQDLLFLIKKRFVTLLIGVAVAAVSFLLIWGIGSVTARWLQLKPNWPVAMSVAAIALAPIFGYQTAGAAGAATAAAIAVLMVFRP
jgi:hypothetical protein